MQLSLNGRSVNERRRRAFSGAVAVMLRDPRRSARSNPSITSSASATANSQGEMPPKLPINFRVEVCRVNARHASQLALGRIAMESTRRGAPMSDDDQELVGRNDVGGHLSTAPNAPRRAVLAAFFAGTWAHLTRLFHSVDELLGLGQLPGPSHRHSHPSAAVADTRIARSD